jgi:hypothetical protein
MWRARAKLAAGTAIAMAAVAGGVGPDQLGLQPSEAHTLLLLFCRANVGKTGVLDSAELSEVGWMVMLGEVASHCAALVQEQGEAAALGPAEWLALTAAHCGGGVGAAVDPERLRKFVRTCAGLIDTFPELHIECDSEVAALVGDLAAEPGPRMVNTLLCVAAHGNAALVGFLVERYAPDLGTTFGSDGLGLLDLVSRVAAGPSGDAAGSSGDSDGGGWEVEDDESGEHGDAVLRVRGQAVRPGAITAAMVEESRARALGDGPAPEPEPEAGDEEATFSFGFGDSDAAGTTIFTPQESDSEDEALPLVFGAEGEEDPMDQQLLVEQEPSYGEVEAVLLAAGARPRRDQHN